MGGLKVFAIVCVLVCAWCTVNAIDIKSVLENVPSDERVEFVKHYLKRGRELSQDQEADVSNQNTKVMDMSDEFAVLLHRYAVTRCIICFDDGCCVDMCDPGIHPKLVCWAKRA